MKILLVEDDRYQAEWLIDYLADKLPSSEVKRIKSVRDFEVWAEGALNEALPDLIITDWMLRYACPPSFDGVDKGFLNIPEAYNPFEGGRTCKSTRSNSLLAHSLTCESSPQG